ncbi:alpha/beta hydrolase [Tunturiibacter empetritectus]|uniref:Acetyl esterase/lipase n=1 Tax=Tunturiibacter lichenicola TaxID=2051959 RepID=A0A852VMC2_9BACT|nr:alpha/beta hydrolase [Edaphobacter lichenicola]NYF90542.1 acetyl esterase/lipase [Edaphobacter lichenicola]
MGAVWKTLILSVLAVLTVGRLGAQQAVWEPSSGHTQLPIWPKTPPDGRLMTGPEKMESVGGESLVAGKPWLAVERVSQPTMTVYSPTGKNTGAAVIVFPGGGYEILAIDLEGTEVCDWLVSKGITCVLLKYRVPAPRSAPSWGAYPQSSMALEDAQRTIGLVRLHAAEWHIDVHKVGVLGFSAGGHLVAATSVHFDRRLYPEVDAADKQSCRPDFAVALYPGHLSVKKGSLELNPDIAAHITAQTPPTFLLQNENDKVDSVWDSLTYYVGLKKAGVPVEFHSYAEGGHAFGLRRTKYPATAWPQLVETWLRTIGTIPD